MGRVDNVIIGAGSVGTGIARELCLDNRSVLLIDRNPDLLVDIADYSGFAEAGDALDIDFLREVDASSAKCAIIVTQDDNTNLYLADVFHYIFKVENIIVRLKDSRKAKIIRYDVKLICPFKLSLNDFKAKYFGKE